jgi:hypothetical protein
MLLYVVIRHHMLLYVVIWRLYVAIYYYILLCVVICFYALLPLSTAKIMYLLLLVLVLYCVCLIGNCVWVFCVSPFILVFCVVMLLNTPHVNSDTINALKKPDNNNFDFELKKKFAKFITTIHGQTKVEIHHGSYSYKKVLWLLCIIRIRDKVHITQTINKKIIFC